MLRKVASGTFSDGGLVLVPMELCATAEEREPLAQTLVESVFVSRAVRSLHCMFIYYTLCSPPSPSLFPGNRWTVRRSHFPARSVAFLALHHSGRLFPSPSFHLREYPPLHSPSSAGPISLQDSLALPSRFGQNSVGPLNAHVLFCGRAPLGRSLLRAGRPLTNNSSWCR